MAVDRIALLEKYRASLTDFAADCLTIRDKLGNFVPLQLNDTQKIVNERLDKQLETRGFVRAMVLKGRQPGISTYVAGRYYRRATLWRGVNVFILAHEQPAADALFGIVDRYQRHNPLAPRIGISNVKELIFDKLESSYVVATAGAKAAGRSRTITLFHGSEVAFWNNAPEHFASSVQTVPLAPGTEIILESTANGPVGEFYERWQDAEAGRGDYEAIFVPWFVHAEYQRTPDPDFEPAKEATDGEGLSETDYMELFGLTPAQLQWRRGKILELRSESLFRQEYPATPQEAFSRVKDGFEPYIKPSVVIKARKRAQEAKGPLILGVDPAGGGGDRFAVAGRRGYCVEFVEYRNKLTTQEGILWITNLIETLKPARVNIDAGGIGHSVITGLRLVKPEYVDIVRAVNFGGTSQHRMATPKIPGPWNRRAEMYMRLKDWLHEEIGVSLPDQDALQSDICAPREKPRGDNFFLLEAKTDMKKRGIRSPDLADAVALTFSFNEFITNYHEPKPRPTFGDVAARAEPVTQFPVPPAGPLSWLG